MRPSRSAGAWPAGRPHVGTALVSATFALVDDLSAYIFALEKDPRLRDRLSISAIIVGVKM